MYKFVIRFRLSRETAYKSTNLLSMKQIFISILFCCSFFLRAQNVSPVYSVNPDVRYQEVEGWGASLCWWAHMCGRWDEKKVDDIIHWITSPDKLNMNIFRYNIGGGDDPSHADGHMVKGKGKRAEMEGFKALPDAPYDWTADAGQRLVMLKIKEVRPDAVFEAFSNSPPYWMTISGCSGGHEQADKDNLAPENYDAFCDYLIDVCLHYRDTYGITFKTLEAFNEATSSYWYYKGSQEGCHFDPESQVKVIRILSEKLKKSGLNTVLSASDETDVASFIRVLKQYKASGNIFEKLGQLNTHTYSADNTQRMEARRLVEQTGLPFWQSETGPSGGTGSGLESNLHLAQKLFDDMRYMKPSAWLDWQLVEEHGGEWCQIRGNFTTGEYTVVKNLYVRMQVTRFIKQKYVLIESGRDNMLAALSPDGKELVVVLLNSKKGAEQMQLDLSRFAKTGKQVKGYRTSEHENCDPIAVPLVKGKSMDYTLPAQSITTFVIPVRL